MNKFDLLTYKIRLMKKIIKTATIIMLLLFTGYVTTVDAETSVSHTRDSSKALINLQLSNQFKPVKKGKKVIITVTFDTARVKSVNIPNVGTATKEQLEEGKCSFTVKPKKTTKYTLEYKAKFHKSLPLMDDKIPFEIVVIDEKGNKIE